MRNMQIIGEKHHCSTISKTLESERS